MRELRSKESAPPGEIYPGGALIGCNGWATFGQGMPFTECFVSLVAHPSDIFNESLFLFIGARPTDDVLLAQLEKDVRTRDSDGSTTPHPREPF